MPKLDLKKELKDLYTAPKNKCVIVDVPEMSYLMIDGVGDPNTAQEYREAIEALYSVAYTAKFAVKGADPDADFAVMPLEGLWWADDMAAFTQEDKDNWKWTAMILQPPQVTGAVIDDAATTAAGKKDLPALDKLRFESFHEGPSAQTMHMGPYAEEARTIQRLHDFIRDEGYERRGLHHEIYLSDPRRTAPAKLKTIIRQPVQSGQELRPTSIASSFRKQTIMSTPSDQIRIGVIGVRGRGELAKHWHQPGGDSVVVAGADINEDHLADFRSRIDESAFTTTEYRRLLDRDDIDAIAVTSPDYCHEEHAVAALEAGKHVFCEKPLAITVEGCDRILEAWQRSGVRLMVGFNMRHMNIFRCMKEIADSGVIGEIKAVWIRHFVAHGGEWYFHDWHANRMNSTGLLLQKASHDIDMMHWITGVYTKRVAAFGGLDFYGGDKPNDLECPDCPERETCNEYQEWPGHQSCVFRGEVNVEDNSVVIMELEGGIKATYTQCHFSPDYFRNYTFIGTEGRMENLDDESRVIVLTRDRSKRAANLARRTYDVKPAAGSHGGADPVICRDFVDMVQTGKEPVSTPLAGRMSVAVGCAATESLRNGGRVVEVAPVPEHLPE